MKCKRPAKTNSEKWEAAQAALLQWKREKALRELIEEEDFIARNKAKACLCNSIDNENI